MNASEPLVGRAEGSGGTPVLSPEQLALVDALLAHAPFGFAFLDRELRYVHVNTFLAAMNGRTVAEHVGQRMSDLFPEMEALTGRRLREVLETGEPMLDLELSGHPPGRRVGRRYWVASYYPVPGPDGGLIGVATAIVDLTDRKMASDQLRQRARQQAAVAALGLEALGGDGLDSLLERAAGVAADLLEVPLVEFVEFAGDTGSGRVRAGIGWDEDVAGAVQPLPDDLVRALEPRPGQAVELSAGAEAGAPLTAWHRRHGVRRGIAVPVGGQRQPFGYLGAYDVNDRNLTRDDVSFLQSVANVVGAAVDRNSAQFAVEATAERLTLALEAGRLGIWEWDATTDRVVWSESLERIHGLGPGSFGGTFQDWAELLHPDDRTWVLAAVREAIETGADHVVEHRVVLPDGSVRWVEGRGRVARDAGGRARWMRGIAADITGRKEAEAERAKLLALEQAARQRLAFLSEATRALVRSLDYRRTLPRVARLAVPVFADCCLIDITEGGKLVRVARAHADTDRELHLRELEEPLAGIPGGLDPISEVLDTGEPHVFTTLPTDRPEGAAGVADHLDLLRSIGIASVLCVPLTARGRSLGVITFGVEESRAAYGAEELALAEDLARRAGLAIDNSRLFDEVRSAGERFRSLAETLQSSLLPPRLVGIPGVQTAALYRPARDTADVGGDFYDLFTLGDDAWGVVVGDVCGKGIAAASLTGLTRYTVRTAAMEGHAPKPTLELLNDVILHDDETQTRFCTVAYGRLEATGAGFRLVLALGGHPAPFVVRGDGSVEEVGTPGTLIGALEEAQVAEQVVELRAGDTVVLFTDGILEARGDSGLFGEARLVATLRDCRGLSADDAVRRIEQAVLDHSDGGTRDDIAILALRVTG